MNCEFEHLFGFEIIRIKGHIDSVSCKDFYAVVMPIAEKVSCKIIIDMSEVEYISSAGLRVFLLAAKQADRQGGKIVIFGTNPWVYEIFSIAGFSKIINILESEDDARGVF